MNIDEIVADDGNHLRVQFPDNLAKTSNLANQMDKRVIFRNYHRHVDYSTLEAVAGGSEGRNAGEEASARHLQEVAMIENMYEKKVAKSIKQQLKTENEPVACLRPKQPNVDLKRGLEVKLAQVSALNDKAILEILSKYLDVKSHSLFAEEKREAEEGKKNE